MSTPDEMDDYNDYWDRESAKMHKEISDRMFEISCEMNSNIINKYKNKKKDENRKNH